VTRGLAYIAVGLVLVGGSACGGSGDGTSGRGKESDPAAAKGFEPAAVKEAFAAVGLPLGSLFSHEVEPASDLRVLLWTPGDAPKFVYVAVWREAPKGRVVLEGVPESAGMDIERVGNVFVYVPEGLDARRKRAVERAIARLKES
jgi:hypothetical protein